MRLPTGKAWLGVAAGLALAMVVAGCTDGQGRAGTLPSRTSTPTATSASPSPTPTTPEAEIEAFVRDFYAEITRAAATNDPSRLATMTTDGCPCAVYARGIEKFRKQGKRAVGARWTVQSIKAHDVMPSSGMAEVRYEVSAYKVVDAQGKVLDQFPSETSHVDLVLTESQQGWMIVNASNLEASR